MNVKQLCHPETIRDILGKNGFRFSKSKGQNFLVDPSVPMRIAEAAGVDERTGVLEVGPGIGCLTACLAPWAGKVVCVELDTTLQPILAQTLREYENVEIVYGDVLKTDLRALTAEKFSGLRPVVCANLPYNITSPVITAFLETGCFETITVMVQKEVARRMAAKPGNADYGAFSVLVQWYTQPELLFDVPPHCFVPAPKVTSSVIRLQKRETPPAKVMDERLFFRTVRSAFNQRRKTMANALVSGFGECTKEQILKVLVTCGFDEKVRGEALSLSDFAKLSNVLAMCLKNPVDCDSLSVRK